MHVANVARCSLFGNAVCCWASTMWPGNISARPLGPPHLFLSLWCARPPGPSHRAPALHLVSHSSYARRESEFLELSLCVRMRGPLVCPNPLADWNADSAAASRNSIFHSRARTELICFQANPLRSLECGDNLYMHLIYNGFIALWYAFF